MTIKQEKAIAIIAESGGTKTPTEAMREAGYPESTVQHPSVLTKSKAYQELMLPKLKENGVTIDKYIENVGKAMNAVTLHYHIRTKRTKLKDGSQVVEDESYTEEEENIGLRLQGNKQAEKLLKIDQITGSGDKEGNSGELSIEDMQALLKAGDEIELTKLVFKRNT